MESSIGGVLGLVILLAVSQHGNTQECDGLCWSARCSELLERTSLAECCRSTSMGFSYSPCEAKICYFCLVYGWVKQDDDGNTIPQETITAVEGSTVNLTIGYERGYPNIPRRFQISTSGTAGSDDYQLVSSVMQLLLVDPIPFTVQLLNDGVAAEGEETLTLSLTEINAYENENEFLLATIDIRIRDLNISSLQPPLPSTTVQTPLLMTTFHPQPLPTSTRVRIPSISSVQLPLPSTTVQIPLLTPPSVPPLEISLSPVVSDSSIEVHVEANKEVKARVILRDVNRQRHKQNFIGTSGSVTFTNLPAGKGYVKAVAREDDGGRYDTGWVVFAVN